MELIAATIENGKIKIVPDVLVTVGGAAGDGLFGAQFCVKTGTKTRPVILMVLNKSEWKQDEPVKIWMVLIHGRQHSNEILIRKISTGQTSRQETQTQQY